MEFLKSVFSTFINVTIGPFIRLRNLMSMGKVELVMTAGDIASRVAIVASYFVSVPAFLVTAAWVWIIAVPVIALIAALVILAFTMASLNKLAATVSEEAANDQDATPVAAAA